MYVHCRKIREQRTMRPESTSPDSHYSSLVSCQPAPLHVYSLKHFQIYYHFENHCCHTTFQDKSICEYQGSPRDRTSRTPAHTFRKLCQRPTQAALAASWAAPKSTGKPQRSSPGRG